MVTLTIGVPVDAEKYTAAAARSSESGYDLVAAVEQAVQNVIAGALSDDGVTSVPGIVCHTKDEARAHMEAIIDGAAHA